jgi:MerR family mercuric resistance operon transcriptional regulator
LLPNVERLTVVGDAKSADVRKRAEAKIADIDAKIRNLDSMKTTLRRLAKVCAGCGPITECPILESLDGEEM